MALAIRETEISGERFMRMGATLLVASKSESNVWHQIENATCTCPSFKFRGACRHLVAAAHIETPVTTYAPPIVEWSVQFTCWRVYWPRLQHFHGGGHAERQDAIDHAQRLQEEDERDAWLSAHGYGD